MIQIEIKSVKDMRCFEKKHPLEYRSWIKWSAKCPTPALYFVPAIVMTNDGFAMRQIGNLQNGPRLSEII